MNYLGHAFLAFGDAELLTGNLIADYVKGKLALEDFTEGIRKGIMLHRKIDVFTDEHPATNRAKILFKPIYGLYAAAIMDCLYDHYLANDPKYFPSEEALLKFSLETYTKAEKYASYFPEKFAAYFPYMKEHNWLYNYRTMQGMERSLNGLKRRALHMPEAEEAYKTFVVNYYILAQCYYEFIDDIIKFVKIELTS
jgi:acyl carrier protein phosphodiesterase